ncbi:hypothetical protein [Flavivirga sp. 57AJ16]|uniref:hypothetical protein n=1 Tax=Flavivirga sp. 57AJ16 TaxID=3025307 RepID=UPI00236621FD|nr:hypothetical protein [Flavivirga sp. 57AJ16]MDD7886626.1 hypothetical protein [Flavivirga sp. 57AJ16]
MKTIKITLVIITIASIFASCKKDGKKEIAQEKLERYHTYVDSVTGVSTNEAAKNWDAIEKDYKDNKAEASNAIEGIHEKAEMQEAMDKSTADYEAFKAEVIAENERIQQDTLKTALRRSLLGKDYSGDDMKFMWINKDNILSVYETFVSTVEKNKDAYSREDWDEIKLIYEAIDTRKNTVEKEGLTSADNRKIAALKLKFAPMHTFNRMGAKSEENAKAKQ